MTATKGVLVVAAAAAVLLASAASGALAASLKSQLVGTWILVSETSSHGTQPFGAQPVGIAIYDRSGHFSTQRMRADLPKFAANSRNGGTDAENRAVVQGIMSLFGTYTVDENTQTRLLHIIGASYPNIAGTDLEESVVIKGDLMTIANPITTIVWQRAK